MTARLPSGFSAKSEFTSKALYVLMPFNFLRLRTGKVLVVNIAGEHLLLPSEIFAAFVNETLPASNPYYRELLAKHLLSSPDDSLPLELLTIKKQAKIKTSSEFTGLHIFVVTLRCDHSCQYCQVSRQNADRGAFDMSKEDAERALEWVFKTPNKYIKIEFQGGESLLNFELIQYIVTRAKEINSANGKNLQFVIATNLVYLSESILDFAEQENILFSTSLDGPAELHNANRPRPAGNSYELAVSGINRIRNRLGYDRVGALMTTTQRSLSRVREIIDTYVGHGFRALFLRPLSPFGFAIKTRQFSKYSAHDWLAFYKEGLDYIISLNRQGIELREQYACLLLRKILTPYGTGYVDLQNPSGSAIGAIVFNYDGKVYASDEGRMLAEMGNATCEIGMLGQDSYETVMTSPKLVGMLKDTILEGVPMCSDCAFSEWCGVDIAHHIATQNDSVGHKAFSSFCNRHMGLFEHLITLMDEDTFTKDLFHRWAWD